MLQVDKLHQYYGGSHILRGLSFDVKVGEVTCLLGRNGVGKTTLLKCLMGLLPVKEGSVQWEGQPITTLKPHQRVHAGIAYVPQGREIFGRLTVEENLLMGLSRFLKVMNPAIKVVCAQPTKGHYIQGLKNMEEAIVPDIYDPSKIDVQELVESEEAIDMARRIISAEGIFAGMSSGAAMLAAVRTAARIESGNIVVVFPDRAEKYLSTTMFREFED